MKKTIAFAAGLALALPGLAGEPLAQTRDQTRDQVREQVRQMLLDEGRVPQRAMVRIQEGIERHAGDQGYGEAIRTAVHESLEAGCKGTCLADVIHGINGAMDRGASARDAAREATRAGAESGARMHDRARDRTSDPQRDMARDRDRARDRLHDGTGRGGMRPGRR